MKIKFLSITAAIFLTACGGGGGGSAGSTASAGTAEGAYKGTTSAGQNFQTLILENGEVWALYGTETGGTLFVDGFIQGSGSSNNGSFSTSNGKDFGFSPAVSGSLSGTYVAGSSISGTVANTGGSRTFSGTAIPSTDYNYNTPASISTISGSWSMSDLDSNSVSISIASNGAISGSSGGCSFTGNINPRASGKNVFNFTISFDGVPCALPGQTASGIAVSNLINGGPTRQLLVLGTDQARTVGTVLFGTK